MILESTNPTDWDKQNKTRPSSSTSRDNNDFLEWEIIYFFPHKFFFGGGGKINFKKKYSLDFFWKLITVDFRQMISPPFQTPCTVELQSPLVSGNRMLLLKCFFEDNSKYHYQPLPFPSGYGHHWGMNDRNSLHYSSYPRISRRLTLLWSELSQFCFCFFPNLLVWLLGITHF